MYLENLQVGITNIQILEDRRFFNNIENGIKVTKPEAMAKQPAGRSFLQVPLDLQNQLVITMTWLKETLRLDLIAQVFSSSSDNPYACKVGYFNPKCKGLVSLVPDDPKIMGQTLQLMPNALQSN